MAYYAPSNPSQTSYKPRPYSLPPPPSRPSSYVSSSPSSPNRRPYTHQSRNSATAPFLPYSEPTFSPISAFNPKKITEEALRPKKKNQQPAAPYVHLDFHTNFADAKIIRDDIPCPVGIRTVALVRWTGVVCRALQALGAGGILVGFIAMRKMEEGTGWMCRVPVRVFLCLLGVKTQISLTIK